MKKDIANRQDIELLVDEFYKKVVKDDVIGYFFNEVVKLDWEKHIPIMYNFWETTLLHVPKYKGNPMQVHIALDEKATIEEKHFERWLWLFTQTTDGLFEGEKAELAKTRAESIATLIKIKLVNRREV